MRRNVSQLTIYKDPPDSHACRHQRPLHR